MSSKARRGRSTRHRASPSNGRRGLFITGGALAVIAAIVVSGILATGMLDNGKESVEPAPDLVLANTSGQEFHLSDEQGKPLLLYFSFPG